MLHARRSLPRRSRTGNVGTDEAAAQKLMVDGRELSGWGLSTPHPDPLLVRGGEGGLLSVLCFFVASRFRVVCVFRGYGNPDVHPEPVTEPVQQPTNAHL